MKKWLDRKVIQRAITLGFDIRNENGFVVRSGELKKEAHDWKPIGERNGEEVYVIFPGSLTESVALGAFEGLLADWTPYGKDVCFVVEEQEWTKGKGKELDHRRILKARIAEAHGSES